MPVIRKIFSIAMSALMLNAVALAAAPSSVPSVKPKYGPQATVLSQSHEFFKKSAAPDFWALMPYYAAQMDGSACSVASVAMVLNGARVGKTMTADDELITQQTLVKKVKNKAWNKGLMGSLGGKYATSLDELGQILREAFMAYGMTPSLIEVVHVDRVDAETREKLHQVLIENEKSARDFVLINFNQQVYTGDAEVGHIAPIGAYDAENRRVLVLDPDRTWYEPYWISEETLLAGMNTQDSTLNRYRGYVRVKF